MIKIEIDPITRRILSYSKVMSSTPLYKDDILLDDAMVPAMDLNKYFIDGKITSSEKSDYERAMDELEAKLFEFNGFNEQNYFFDLVKKGSTLEAAREQLEQKLLEKQRLEKEYEQLSNQHKEDIYSYYAMEYKEKEAQMKFQYYSAVVLLIKDENRYLSEWLKWYHKLGFHHIFIYDNGQKERVSEVITTLDKDIQSNITIIEWQDTYENIQEEAYNHFLDAYGKQCRWCLFADSDEFLRFTNGETDVNRFLKSYEDYTEVWGYLEEYNADGQEAYEDKSVRERFTEKFNEYEMYYWKNFIQVNRIDRFHRHYAYYDESKGRCYRNESINKDLFVIEHYYTKSWEEWKEKILTRGSCDPEYKRKLNDFFKYNPDMIYLMDEDSEQAYQEGGQTNGDNNEKQ